MSCGGCSGAVDRVLKKLDGMIDCILLLSVSLLYSIAIIFPSHNNLPLHPTSANPTYNQLTSLLTGVKSYEVSLDSQTATVVATPTLDYETVLKTIAKTGKKVNSGEMDGETRSIELKE